MDSLINFLMAMICIFSFIQIKIAHPSGAQVYFSQNLYIKLTPEKFLIKQFHDQNKNYSNGKDIVVAVIDTGIDATHSSLKNHLWQNPYKKHPSYGFDFVNNTDKPIDENGHGTHVSGIIAADPANPTDKFSMHGVATNVKIMAVRYYSESAPGYLNLSNTIKALNYAVNHGANIINYSGGGPEYNEDEYQALKRAEKKGILVVVAAGNDHHNTDEEQNGFYPANYEEKGLTNMITVGSVDAYQQTLPSSNFGPKTVDISALGQDVLSTVPGGRWITMTGTSQATPYVTGIAVKLLQFNRTLSPAQLKALILTSAKYEPQLNGKNKVSGVASLESALVSVQKFLNVRPPLVLRNIASQ
jgi:thermitase